MLDDFRYAVRGIARRPAHAVLVIFTLALGLGINTVAFSSVNALVFRPFAVPGGESFGWIFVGTTRDPIADTSQDAFEALQEGARSFETIAAEGRLALTGESPGGPEHVWALAVSAEYFSVVTPPMRLGRPLSPSDVTDGVVPILISERYWAARFDRSTNVLGQGPVLNGQLTAVLGVVRDDYQGPGGLFEPQVWLPLEAVPALGAGAVRDRDAAWLTLIGRPKGGTPRGVIDAELLAVARGRVAGEVDAVRAQYVPLHDGHPEARLLGRVALLGMAAVGLVLLIACLNVAGLILARSVERQRELGVRAALGAGRGRLTRLLFAEGLILAVLAGSAALLLASLSESLLGSLSLPAPIPQRLHFSVDWRMLIFTAAMVAVAAAVPTVTPAWRISRLDPIRWLKGAGSDGGLAPAGIRRVFVRLQVVGSTTFLTLALMFGASHVASTTSNPGFNTSHTAVMQVQPAADGPALPVADLVARLIARTDLAAVAVADRVSFQIGAPASSIVASDARDCTLGGCLAVSAAAVSASFFDALEIPVRAGRTFATPLGSDRDVVIVNEVLAQALWPGTTAVGQWLTDTADGRPRQVIGVVGTVVTTRMGEAPRPSLYRPFTDDLYGASLAVITRGRTGADVAAKSLREEWRHLNPRQAPSLVMTMEERLALPLWPGRVAAVFFATCGLVAVLLVSVGLYGVTRQLVNQRTREFGIRMALGATGADLRRLILGESIQLVVPALIAGLLVAGGAGSLARAALTGLSPLDPRLYLLAFLLQLGVTVAASWGPALKASRVTPHTTMRSE